jgi:HSP20 family protein
MNLKNMNLKKLIPWNWFKKEQETTTLPIKRLDSSGDPLTQLHSDIDRLFGQTFRAPGDRGLIWAASSETPHSRP